jgi:hypothetical protein
LTAQPSRIDHHGTPKLAHDRLMTIEQFLAFTDTRPQGERWELIEECPS